MTVALSHSPSRDLWNPVVTGSLVAGALSYPLAALFVVPGESGVLVTAPSIALLVIAGVVGLVRTTNEQRVSNIVISLLVLAFLGGTYFYRDDVDQVDKILQLLGVMTLFGLILSFALSWSRFVELMPLGLAMIGLGGAFALALNTSEFDFGRLSYGDSNPIWMARIFGLAAMGGVFLALRRQNEIALWAGFILVMIVGIVVTGSRGPLLSLAISLATAPFFLKFRNKTVIVSTGLALAGVIVIAAFALSPAEALRALSLGDTGDASYFFRIEMIDYSIGLISVYPSGIGVGNFEFFGFIYPHNIFLEIFVEWGWLTGTTFCLAVLVAGIGLLLLGQNSRILWFIFVYELANATASGDVTSPRFLYALIIVGLARVLTMGGRYVGGGRHDIVAAG